MEEVIDMVVKGWNLLCINTVMFLSWMRKDLQMNLRNAATLGV